MAGAGRELIAAVIDGRAVQAGLYPNPTVGYEADRIGAAGTAGEMQGAFIDQTIVAAGKLRLSRAKYAHEVCLLRPTGPSRHSLQERLLVQQECRTQEENVASCAD